MTVLVLSICSSNFKNDLCKVKALIVVGKECFCDRQDFVPVIQQGS